MRQQLCSLDFFTQPLTTPPPPPPPSPHSFRASAAPSEDIIPCISMFLELVQSLKAAELTAKDGQPYLFPRSLIKVMVVNEASDLLLLLRDTVRVSHVV